MDSLVLDLPLDLPLAHQRLWTSAFNDGYTCGVTPLGYQEQNPYNIGHPLFDAWRSGWFQAVYDTPLYQLTSRKLPKNLLDVLDVMWKRILTRSK